MIGNALKYGQSAAVRVLAAPQNVTLEIEDQGPGIPEDELEKVLAPFYRIEASRSRDTGGTGLGLTIAQSVIESHGGTLQLKNRPEGGLLVRVVLAKLERS